MNNSILSALFRNVEVVMSHQLGVDKPLPSGGEGVAELCDRFLRARSSDVAAAAEMLATDTRWRQSISRPRAELGATFCFILFRRPAR